MYISESYKNKLKRLSGIISEAILGELNIEDVEIPKHYIKDSLNPKVWDGLSLKPELREKLLKIADEYIKYLDIPVKPERIMLLGSMANYNWNDSSDFDLHLVYDFNKISKDEKFVKDFFDTKGSNWKSNHDITLKDYDVEIYVQEKEEENKSVGVFNLSDNTWIREPKREHIKVDKESIKKKAASIATRIEQLEEDAKTESDLDKIYKEAKSIKDKIKKMRQAGLDESGEFSAENLAFKYLRNNDYLERLGKIASESFDKNLSMAESIIDEVEEVESLNGYNGWEKQPEWHGNPKLGFDSYKKFFKRGSGHNVPVYIFGKEGKGKNTPTWGTDKKGNRVQTGKFDAPDWQYVVSAGADSDLSHSGGFYPETPTLTQAMDIVDERYKNKKLLYEAEHNIDQKHLRKIVFKNKRRPGMIITVTKTTDGKIVDIDNQANIKFPYNIGQTLDMGHQTWACNNHFLVNDKDTCPEEKVFGLRKSDIQKGHELRLMFPSKFRNESEMKEAKELYNKDNVPSREELEIKRVAKKGNLDIARYEMKELIMGYKVEKEHGSINPITNITNDDEIKTLKIALAHLNEVPNYYTKLNKYVEKGISESLNESTEIQTNPKHRLIIKKSVDNIDADKIKLIKEFIIFCCQELNINKPCCVFLTGTRGGPITTTASYNPENDHIWIYTKNRNMLADPLRSLAHEIRHFKQKLDGVLTDESGNDGSIHENEANSFSGEMIRKFGKKNREIYK